MTLAEIVVLAIGLPIIILSALLVDRKDSMFDGLDYNDED